MLILSMSINLSCSAQQNAIKGYEWLEGEWEGYVNDDWGKIIITPSTYKMVYCFSNKSMDEIASAEEVPISIGNHNSYIVGNEILALDKDNPIIGIDVKKQQLYIILGEYNSLYLQKITENTPATTEGKMSIDDNPNLSKISSSNVDIKSSLDFSKTYGWDDDGLKGKVKRMEESSMDYDDKDWGTWEIEKEYDSLGRICYIKRNHDRVLLSNSSPIYSMGFSSPEKMGGWRYNALEVYGRFLNPLHMLGYDASKKRYSTDVINAVHVNGVYTFDYNNEGLVNNIYYNYKLINRCEYDEWGRLITRYEDNLPTLQIEWDNDCDNINRTSFKIKWFYADGQLMNTLPCIWNGDVLKVCHYPNEYKEYFFNGNTLSSYKVHHDTKLDSEHKLSYEGNMLKIEEKDVVNRVINIFVYNENGYLSEQRTEVYKFIYNESGVLLDEKKLGENTYSRWEYQYDDYGNWTKATEYKVTIGKDITFEEELKTVTRKYEYYE